MKILVETIGSKKEEHWVKWQQLFRSQQAVALFYLPRVETFA